MDTLHTSFLQSLEAVGIHIVPVGPRSTLSQRTQFYRVEDSFPEFIRCLDWPLRLQKNGTFLADKFIFHDIIQVVNELPWLLLRINHSVRCY